MQSRHLQTGILATLAVVLVTGVTTASLLRGDLSFWQRFFGTGGAAEQRNAPADGSDAPPLTGMEGPTKPTDDDLDCSSCDIINDFANGIDDALDEIKELISTFCPPPDLEPYCGLVNLDSPLTLGCNVEGKCPGAEDGETCESYTEEVEDPDSPDGTTDVSRCRCEKDGLPVPDPYPHCRAVLALEDSIATLYAPWRDLLSCHHRLTGEWCGAQTTPCKNATPDEQNRCMEGVCEGQSTGKVACTFGDTGKIGPEGEPIGECGCNAQQLPNPLPDGIEGYCGDTEPTDLSNYIQFDELSSNSCHKGWCPSGFRCLSSILALPGEEPRIGCGCQPNASPRFAPIEDGAAAGGPSSPQASRQ